jgi:uncharacterized membrane protein YphA (DoxX/SURF4 family)
MSLYARKLSNFLVRVTLGLVFLWAGIGKLFLNARPPLDQLITFLPLNTSLLILGILEVAVGLMLVIGLFTRIAGWVAAVLFVAFVVGGSLIGIFTQAFLLKDVALLAASLELAWTGSRMWGLDNKI